MNGQFVPGPTQPIEMDPPEGGYTHYLGGGYGDRPIVGLTEGGRGGHAGARQGAARHQVPADR